MELCKHKYSSGECVLIPLETIEYQTWIHFCLIYTQKRVGNNFHTKAKAYFEGNLVETSRRKGEKNFARILESSTTFDANTNR